MCPRSGFLCRRSFFLYPRSGFGTVVPFFVPGNIRQNHPFTNPPFGEPLKHPQNQSLITTPWDSFVNPWQAKFTNSSFSGHGQTTQTQPYCHDGAQRSFASDAASKRHLMTDQMRNLCVLSVFQCVKGAFDTASTRGTPKLRGGAAR